MPSGVAYAPSEQRNLPAPIRGSANTTGGTTTRNIHRVTETHLPHVDDEMLTLKEVATMLRVPEATVRYWRHLSKGPRGFRIGRSVRYWRTEVALWLEEQSRTQDEI